MKDCSVQDHGTSLPTLHHTGTVGVDILTLSHYHIIIIIIIIINLIIHTCSGTQASTHFSRLSGHSLF